MKRSTQVKHLLNAIYVLLTAVIFILLMSVSRQAEKFYEDFGPMPEFSNILITFYGAFNQYIWLAIFMLIITGGICFGILFLVSRKMKLGWTIAFYLILYLITLPALFFSQYLCMLWPFFTMASKFN